MRDETEQEDKTRKHQPPLQFLVVGESPSICLKIYPSMAYQGDTNDREGEKSDVFVILKKTASIWFFVLLKAEKLYNQLVALKE
ncbi:hypothetical protein NC652_025138 [Populus alba x Populus x berolinensis]|uniref:Uncharacterized protein n=1 Tax=Populus alba x Populus x berolinensis TaxID=444605 RepID=A0AAD6M9L0_9ROSI|nr:hypothetical protein NC652_025138 [Populus alba x Populus x berolinensis]KAJ6981478.1 hypothetical protein NC653_024770 [Populus alba x Populus x berolinensis]